MDLRIFLSSIYMFVTLHVVFSDSSSYIDLSTLDYSIRQTFNTRKIQFTFDSSTTSMKIICSKCYGQLDVTCQENDLINVTIQLQGSKQTMTVPFNVSCSMHSDSKNTFIVDSINNSSNNNTIFVDWIRPSSTIKEYLVYCMTSTTHKSQQISTNHISFDDLSDNTWHQICIASIDNLWRTSRFTCKNVLTNTIYKATSLMWLPGHITSKMYEVNKTNRQIWPLHVVLVVAIAIILLVSVFLTRKYNLIGKLKYRTVGINRGTLVRLSRSFPLVNSIRNTRSNTEIKTSEFSSTYELIVKNHYKPIIIEYVRLLNESLIFEESLGLTKKIAQESQNICKNHFANINPYDQNCVILGNKKASRKYINASIIPFQNDENNTEYIASQGPIASTVSEFWQMIWEQNVHIIIMLIRPQENDQFKCVKYWPTYEGDHIFYGVDGQYQVILKNEENLETHIERMILVFNKKLKMERNIHQFYMPSWLDYEAPPLDNFSKCLLRYHRVSNLNMHSPLLVHCSAGVGATGTFIAIDRIIKNLVNDSSVVNIYQTVLELRLRRNFMVQRQIQYKFIYKYIDYFLKKYMTDAECSYFSQVVLQSSITIYAQ